MFFAHDIQLCTYHGRKTCSTFRVMRHIVVLLSSFHLLVLRLIQLYRHEILFQLGRNRFDVGKMARDVSGGAQLFSIKATVVRLRWRENENESGPVTFFSFGRTIEHL